MPWSVSSRAAWLLGCWRIAARMSPAFASSRCALWMCRIAVCSTRRNAIVCSGSRSDAAALSLDRLVEVGAERAPQRRQVRAAGREDPLAVGIVREGVEQVLEREIRMPPRDGFAERDGENDFKSG